MAQTNLHDKLKSKSLYSIGYEYLCNNFHKFSTANKIKISISILQIFNKDDSKTIQTQFLIIEKNPEVKNRLDSYTPEQSLLDEIQINK